MSGYSLGARGLHWIVAGLIVTQYVLAELAEEAGEAGASEQSLQLALLANHKSVGMLVLMLASVRLAWRLLTGAPPPPASMPRWQRRLAGISHWSMYVLIFALPLSGWLFSSAAGYRVSFFNLFAWPDPIAPGKAAEDALRSLHHFLAAALFGVAALHVLAALKHALWDRDGVFSRMASWSWGAVFVALPLVLVYVLGRPLDAVPQNLPAPAGTTTALRDPSPAVNTAVPRWEIDISRSSIEFTGEQAGAPFSGRFLRFDADVRFDPDRLSASYARVVVACDSNQTGDEERDAVMRGAEWFDVEHYPVATFTATAFDTRGSDFVALGQLEIKGLELTFRLDEQGDLDGRARIDRLAFGLGSGQWIDTTWVGRYVDVSVHVERQ